MNGRRTKAEMCMNLAGAVVFSAVLEVSVSSALFAQGGTAIEQNPMTTTCGTTNNIPVDKATSCSEAITAATKLFATLRNTPGCMTMCSP